MAKEIIKLGEKVMVSDPCYGLDTWCQGVLENVLPGNYDCKVEHIDEGVFGVRVAAIEAIHQDASVIRYEAQDFEVGVDSGTAGIFDYDYYAKHHKSSKESDHCDDDWYDRTYDLAYENISNPDYIPFIETSNYKAGILAYRNELDEFIKRNSESNAEIVEHANLEYMELINHYYALDEKLNLPNLSDLIETLNKIKALLEDNDDNAKKIVSTITEEEIELRNIKYKYEKIMHDFWMEYRKSTLSYKTICRATGHTIDGLGFISSSGYGDGGYTCYVSKTEDGKINAIRIEFITEEEEEWDEEEK